MTRRSFAAAAGATAMAQTPKKPVSQRYIRYEKNGQIENGVMVGDDGYSPVRGDLFNNPITAKARFPLSQVKLLYPIAPPKIVAVGRNYGSHIGQTKAPPNPELFFKPTTCLQHPGGPIVIPPDSKNTHYEGELVLVIGKTLSKATKTEAAAGIWGVTIGNDVSERDWQGGPNKDMQWWRAKGADTFGPMGPYIATGLDYSNLKLTTRVNGQVVQQASTSELIYDCATCVSFISRYVTLVPGDVVFTGTPGQTKAMKPGDVCEVELEGVGVLTNPVVAG